MEIVLQKCRIMTPRDFVSNFVLTGANLPENRGELTGAHNVHELPQELEHLRVPGPLLLKHLHDCFVVTEYIDYLS